MTNSLLRSPDGKRMAFPVSGASGPWGDTAILMHVAASTEFKTIIVGCDMEARRSGSPRAI